MHGMINPIRASISLRAYRFTNRELMHRLLTLMLLNANGQNNERAYTSLIRKWLEANHGHPSNGRRLVTDPGGIPSLE
jgi:hypothetical protein